MLSKASLMIAISHLILSNTSSQAILTSPPSPRPVLIIPSRSSLQTDRPKTKHVPVSIFWIPTIRQTCLVDPPGVSAVLRVASVYRTATVSSARMTSIVAAA